MLDYISLFPTSVLSILDSDGNFIEKLPSLVMDSLGKKTTAHDVSNLYSSILSLYEEHCHLFDDAPDINLFDVRYAVKYTVTELDCRVLLYAVGMLENVLDDSDSERIYRDLLKVIGRFTLLFIDNPELHCESNTNSSVLFREAAIRSINCILSRDWSFGDTVLVRLTVLNLFIMMGVKTELAFSDIVKRLRFTHTADSIGNISICVEECLDWYAKSFVKSSLTPEPIQFQWFYSYIYKKRFGVIHCKKFQRTSVQPYTYIASVQSPCFKDVAPRNAGLMKSALCVKNGEVVRSSEYRPTESSFLYNFSTMKFE